MTWNERTGRARLVVFSQGMGDDDWTLCDGDSATHVISLDPRRGFKQQQAYVRYYYCTASVHHHAGNFEPLPPEG